MRTIEASADYLMALMPRMKKSINQRVALPEPAPDHFISLGQIQVLIGLLPGPATMGEIAHRARVKLSTMTETINRLVRQGLVERLTDQHDRRIVRIQLSRKGRERFRRHRMQMRRHFVMLLQTLTARQQREMLQAFHTIDKILLAEPDAADSRRS